MWYGGGWPRQIVAAAGHTIEQCPLQIVAATGHTIEQYPMQIVAAAGHTIERCPVYQISRRTSLRPARGRGHITSSTIPST
eukprot:1160675-Pelagomonas_calceolata.AAC.22